MAHSKTEELLATKMHQLMPDCHTFNRWFVEYKYRGFHNRKHPSNSILNEASIPTLGEFLERNKKPVQNHDHLWSGNEKGFPAQNASFKKLKQFLLDNGITDHWIVGGSKKRQLNLFPMTMLKQRDVLQLPFVTVCNIKAKSNTFQQFVRLFPRIQSSEITVAQVLAIDQEGTETITGHGPMWRLDYAQVQAFRTFILLIQKKLRTLGLSETDGAFMTISFKKKKLPVGISRYLKRKLLDTYGEDYDFSLPIKKRNAYRYAI
jgi:hypothetical protein